MNAAMTQSQRPFAIKKAAFKHNLNATTKFRDRTSSMNVNLDLNKLLQSSSH